MQVDDDGKLVHLGQSLYLYTMNEDDDEDDDENS